MCQGKHQQNAQTELLTPSRSPLVLTTTHTHTGPFPQGKHQENAHLQGGAPCFCCGKEGAVKRCEACRTGVSYGGGAGIWSG